MIANAPPVSGSAPIFRSAFVGEDLERLASGVFDWLMQQRARFTLPGPETIARQSPEEARQCRKRKAFGELGAALRIADRVPELRALPSFEALRKHGIEVAATSDLFLDPVRRVHLLPGMTVAYATLRRLTGCADERTGRELQRALDQGFMEQVERSAWHKLDLKYYLDAAGLRHGFASAERLLVESSLMRPPSLAWCSSMDLYGITHLIFHLTDFGACRLPAATGFVPSELIDYVTLALSMSLCERDFDISAELLMCLICLGAGTSTISMVAAAALTEAQQPDGFIPDRRWQAGFADTPDAQKEEEIFFAVYHPTLVTLFLIACAMGSDDWRRTDARL